VSNGDQWAAWRSRADVLILHHSRPEVLVEWRDGDWRAPRMPIDQLWKMPLGTINQDVRRLYGIETTILLLISQQRDDAACTITSLRLLENHSPDWAPPPDMRWVGAAELDAVAFANAEQRQAAGEILAELAEGRIPVLRPPWARPGWYREAAGWLEAALASSGYRPSGAIEQIKNWDLSCILRVPTERGAVYFKATNPAPLMANEARVSAGLAALFPDRVPAPWSPTPSGAGWRWPTSGRPCWSLASPPRLRFARPCWPSLAGCKSPRPTTSSGCWRSAARIAGWISWRRRSIRCWPMS
jgi:hypothetical protein